MTDKRKISKFESWWKEYDSTPATHPATSVNDKQEKKIISSAIFYDGIAEDCFRDKLVDPDRWLAQHIGRLYGHIDILTEEVKALKRRIKKNEASA